MDISEHMQAVEGGGKSPARVLLREQLERIYQHVLGTCAAVESTTDAGDALRGKLATIDPTGEFGPMAALASRLGLDAAQRQLLWTIVACSSDPRIVPHVEVLAGAHARRGLSLTAYAAIAGICDDLAMQLAHWLAAPNPLVASGLLVVTEQASIAARAYAASSRLVSFLAGNDHEIEPLRLVSADQPLLHDMKQTQALDEISAVLERSADPVLVLEGPIGSGRVTACAHASGSEMIVLDCERVAATQLGEGMMKLRRELLLRRGIPVLANADHILGDEQREARRQLGEFIDRTIGPLVITVTVPGTDLGTRRPLLRIPWAVPDNQIRAQLWTHAIHSIGATPVSDMASLALRYRVGPAAIERAVASVRMLQPDGTALDETALAAGLRHNIAERLGGLAKRVEVTQTWKDLVVSDDTSDLITGLIGRVRHKHRVLDEWGYISKIALGTGVAALLSGPPGTGKTMAAGLIARELDLELYIVDLSQVISKWVGETEKNLARVFDAAEEGHALLLFDEADSLFGQRTADAKTATDRYANLEVNYLLQRVEAFGGITILTTNLATAIDPALKRRLAAHIVFSKPDEDERAALWERMCKTDRAPLARDIDYQDLARMFPDMTGANIRNAALAAAHLAAGDDSRSITRSHLIRASHAEYRSIGHLLADSLGGLTPKRSR